MTSWTASLSIAMLITFSRTQRFAEEAKLTDVML